MTIPPPPIPDETDVRQHVFQLTALMGEFRVDLASTNKNVDRIVAMMEKREDHYEDRLRTVETRQNKPVNVIAIIAVVLSILGSGGGAYLAMNSLRVDPIDDRVANVESWKEGVHGDRYTEDDAEADVAGVLAIIEREREDRLASQRSQDAKLNSQGTRITRSEEAVAYIVDELERLRDWRDEADRRITRNETIEQVRHEMAQGNSP